jgi:hypothetical protein
LPLEIVEDLEKIINADISSPIKQEGEEIINIYEKKVKNIVIQENPNLFKEQNKLYLE